MKDLQKDLKKVLEFVKRYTLLLFVVVFALMYGFLIMASSNVAKREPREVDILDIYQSTKQVNLDEGIAERLKQLEEQNIELKSIFDEARNNPFSE